RTLISLSMWAWVDVLPVFSGSPHCVAQNVTDFDGLFNDAQTKETALLAAMAVELFLMLFRGRPERKLSA
ncbi:MAG: hypothetical protein ABJC64_18830, partial [Paracoccaceae bacterium]